MYCFDSIKKKKITQLNLRKENENYFKVHIPFIVMDFNNLYPESKRLQHAHGHAS